MPEAGKLFRFWLAGPLTLLVFTPLLMAGLFGSPAMLPGMYFAWRMLRSGNDGMGDFALGGFKIAVLTLLFVIVFFRDGAVIYAFGILFGPLMAMCFRMIAGSWREDALYRSLGQTGDTAPVSDSTAPASLARVPCTQ